MMARRTFLVIAAVIAIVAVGGYSWVIRKYTAYYAGGSDSSGYLNAARLLTEGKSVQTVPRIGTLAPPRWDFLWQQPLGFNVNGRTGRIVPTYPVGLPLHYALASVLVGLDFAPVLTNVMLALAAGALIVLFGRELGLSWCWSALGVAVLWACPSFLFIDLQVMSDVAALVWVLAAIWCAERSRSRELWAMAAGFAFSLAILVRPSDALALLPIALALGWNWRAWVLGILGGLPGMVFQGWYNQKLYGDILATGYGDVSASFGLRYVAGSALHFAGWLIVLLTPWIVVPAVVYFLRRRGERRHRWLLATWIAAFGVFYLFYSFSSDGWSYLRFLLPAFPAIVVAAALELRLWWRASAGIGWRRLGVIGWLGVIVPVEVLVGRRLDLLDWKRGEQAYPLAAGWSRERMPPGAIVLQMQTSGAFAYYAHFTLVRWDYLTAENWAELRRVARESGRPIYASLFDFEEGPVTRGVTGGGWKKLTQIRSVSIWKWAPTD